MTTAKNVPNLRLAGTTICFILVFSLVGRSDGKPNVGIQLNFGNGNHLKDSSGNSENTQGSAEASVTFKLSFPIRKQPEPEASPSSLENRVDDVDFKIPIAWVPLSSGANANFAVVGGDDFGKKLYVARAYHDGSLIPGKHAAGYFDGAFVSADDTEFMKKEYEVLIASPGDVSWVKVQSGDKIPENTMLGGFDKSGEALYVARSNHMDTLSCGYYRKDEGKCTIGWDGKVASYKECEVLIRTTGAGNNVV